MHHVVLERWSRGSSALHRRDPRAKLFALAVFLVSLAMATRGLVFLVPMLLALVIGALAAARIPLGAALVRAGVVFSFTAPFAAFSALEGESARAAALLGKSYLSALAALAAVSTTPMPLLLRGMEAAAAPPFLLMVAQFLYRYLFVISEEAQHMRAAAASRGGVRFRAAAGAVGGLFARSHGRAEEIHRAMLARGFEGRFPTLGDLRFGRADWAFAAVAGAAPVLCVLAAGRLAG